MSEASLKVPETLDHFWVDIWLLNSGLIGLNEWFAFLLKKETLAAIGQKFRGKNDIFAYFGSTGFETHLI